MSLKVQLLNSPWINNSSEYGVKSGTRWASIRKKSESMPYFPFPYLMASATAVLKKAGFLASIKDAVAEELTKEDCLQYIKREKPDVLVIEVYTPSVTFDLDFAREAKKISGCLNVLCGLHTSALPKEILQNDFVDFVMAGEYDYTLRELIQFISFGRSDFENILGLGFKDKGSVRINPRREAISDLDELPFPEREGLPMDKYNEPFSKYYPNAKIVTSRGCPYSCIFCTEQLMYNRPEYNRRSIKLILDEIVFLKDRYGIKEVFFDDAIFTIPRAKEIAKGIIDNRIKIAWSCWMDWNISLEDLEFLKKSGCVGVKFGVESASPEILDSARKPVNLEKVKNLVNNCRKLGLFCSGAFMFGLPGETRATLEKTINLIFSLNITSCQLSIATPLPGTQFFKIAQENNWLLTLDWSKYDCHYTSVVEYPECRKEDIESAIATARMRKVKQVLKNPLVAGAYIFKMWKLKGFKGMLGEATKKSSFIIKGIFNKR